MRSKIAEQVPSEDWVLLAQISSILDGLPETIPCSAYIYGTRLGREIAESAIIPNCHVITRALAYFLPVIVHDGTVSEYVLEEGRVCQHRHSWLTRKGGNESIIIDPWPLGSVSGPAIFIQNYAFRFQEGLFRFPPIRIPEFRSEVAATRLAIRKVMQRQAA